MIEQKYEWRVRAVELAERSRDPVGYYVTLILFFKTKIRAFCTGISCLTLRENVIRFCSKLEKPGMLLKANSGLINDFVGFQNSVNSAENFLSTLGRVFALANSHAVA